MGNPQHCGAAPVDFCQKLYDFIGHSRVHVTRRLVRNNHAGAAFIGLSYQYTIRETRDSMERNADYVADFTAKVRAEGIDVRDMAYQLYVANVAHIANAFVLVTEADGELVLCSDGATIQSGLGGNYLPQSIVSQLQKEGGYSGMTTLGGLFPEKRFVAGTPITVKTVNLATGQTEQTMIGVAYVAAETSASVHRRWQAIRRQCE